MAKPAPIVMGMIDSFMMVYLAVATVVPVPASVNMGRIQIRLVLVLWNR